VDGVVVGAVAVRAFCPACETVLGVALAGMPGLYAELREIIGDPAQGADETWVRVSRVDPPMPLRGDVEAALTDIEHVIFGWEHRVRTVLGMPPAPYAGWDIAPARVAGACRLLRDRLPVLLALAVEPMRQPDGTTLDLGGADAGLAVLDVHHRADRTATPHRPVYVVPVPCPRCAAPWLTRRGGDEDVWCGACRSTIPAVEYQEGIKSRLSS
jgi:hypothetical protein